MVRERNIERPLGYAWFIERYQLSVPLPRHVSALGLGGRSKALTREGVREEFPDQFLRDDSEIGQLVFALKYDGVDLLVLRTIFETIGGESLAAALRAKPTSSRLRRLWFLYEFLMARQLDLPDVDAGAYVDVLDEDEYITRPGPKLRRFRVNFNLLGATAHWCPVVRRTDKLRYYESARLDQLAHGAVRELTPRDLQRLRLV